MAGRVQANLAGASNALEVTLTSDFVIPAGCRGVHVGTGGNLKVDFVGGATGITYKNISDGTEKAGQFSKIYSTANGTTAADILVLY